MTKKMCLWTRCRIVFKMVFRFLNSHFTGGVSKADASPMHNPVRSSNPMGGSAPFDACNIIPNAMRFANNDTSQTNKAEVAHAGAANENVGGEDMAGNNRTAPSRAGVVNNSASPLVDMLPIPICDVNAFHIKDVPDVDNGDQPMNEDAPVPLSDIDAHVPPIGKASDQNVIDVGDLIFDSRELSAIVDMSSHLPAKFESGNTAILLIQAPAVGGVDVCNYITPDVLDVKVERIAVMIYEENLGVL
ncbi:unnamed protein product [Brassica oleracea]